MPDRQTLWDRKRLQARTDLIDAALTLFEANGFEQTTVAEIAAAAQQSPRTFFRYFGSKEDVLFDDIGEHLDLLREQISANLDTGQAPWPAVAAAMQSLLVVHLSPSNARRRMRLWMREPALRTRYLEHATSWEAAIAETLSRHRPNVPQPDLYARAIAVAAISGFRVASYTANAARTGDFPRRLAEILDLLGNGLAHEQPARRRAKRDQPNNSRSR